MVLPLGSTVAAAAAQRIQRLTQGEPGFKVGGEGEGSHPVEVIQRLRTDAFL